MGIAPAPRNKKHPGTTAEYRLRPRLFVNVILCHGINLIFSDGVYNGPLYLWERGLEKYQVYGVAQYSSNYKISGSRFVSNRSPMRDHVFVDSAPVSAGRR